MRAEDWVAAYQESQKRSQRYRAVGYFGLSFGAIISTFVESSSSMSQAVPTIYVILWGVVYLTGSVCCMYGALRGGFGGERIGAIAVGCSLIAFGVAVLTVVPTLGTGVLVSASSMIGLGFLFFARWKDVNWHYQNTVRINGNGIH
jgi:hypothetical protein